MSAVGTGQTGRSSGQDTPPSPAPVRHLARHQVMGLASVFLLGMAVNLIGLPSQTSGVAHLASIVFLAAHALIALGLIIGTMLLLRAAARLGGRWRRPATRVPLPSPWPWRRHPHHDHQQQLVGICDGRRLHRSAAGLRQPALATSGDHVSCQI